jgi:hypothetical protein
VSSHRHGRILAQFAPRPIEMISSPAYRALSLSGHRVLSRIEIEFAHHGGEGAKRGNENGMLPVTYDDFVVYGVHRAAIAPALREIVALGFIEITEAGRAGNAEYRSPNKFRLTYRHMKRAEPTNEWRRITSIEAATMIADRARTAKTGDAPKQRRKIRAPVPETVPLPVPETVPET